MSKTATREDFISKAYAIHGDEYDYSLVNYINNCTKVIIICKKHGLFEQEPRIHLTHGCPECGKEKRIKARTLTTDLFVQKAQKIHHGKYDYSKTEYSTSKEKVCIICPIHGEFWQAPSAHLIGNGCPQCAEERRINAITKTQEDFVKKAKQIHGNKYDYSKVEYIHCQKKVCIICPVHGPFWQRPNSHLDGNGCPACATERAYLAAKAKGKIGKSQAEDHLAYLLENHFGKNNVKRQYQDDRYPFHCDFYIVSLDLFIELNAFWTHGGHWFDENNDEDKHMLLFMQEKDTEFYNNAIRTWTVRDPLKRKTAEENNLNYLVFWDNDLTDAKAWLATQ